MESSNIAFQSSKHVLLLGAGFTKNFGGPLAIEMWEKIFNHKLIQSQPRIRKLMMEYFDYEYIYASIIEGSYTIDEKKAIDTAIKFAYADIDVNLRNYARGGRLPYELANIRDLINKFNESGPKNAKMGEPFDCYLPNTQNKSFIFTLNQDLFFERLYDSSYLSIPGIKNNKKWFDSTFRQEIDESDYCILPEENTLSVTKPNLLNDSQFFLIKLHGSYNWKSYDGTQQMVIGRGKKEKIQKEPLLRCYFKFFEEVLSHPQRQLLVIGYGFGDEHINYLIAQSINNHGLKVYVISPELPNNFKDNLLNNTKDGEDIWQGLSGYFPYKLRDIFPENNDRTQISKNLFELYFD